MVPIETAYLDSIISCNNFGGVLASIINETEYIESISLCQNIVADGLGCWFGLNRLSGKWYYVDGNSVNDSLGFDGNGIPIAGVYPWDKYEPGSGSEKCTHLWRQREFEWNDRGRNSEMISLCDKNPPKSCGININNLKVWYKGGLNDISNNGYNAINISGNIYNDINDCSIYGDINSSFIIPYNINTTSYTIIYVGRTNDDWSILTSYPNGHRINSTFMANNSNINMFDIDINIQYHLKLLDQKIYEILIFDEILSEYQMKCIENYLSQEHSIPIPSYTIIPTIHPTKTCPPLDYSTRFPTESSTNIPSKMPSTNPTKLLSDQPTNLPSNIPSDIPTLLPTNNPSSNPTLLPSDPPTNLPSNIPSDIPTLLPTKESTKQPSDIPTLSPTNASSKYPTNNPSSKPTTQPSNNPSTLPTIYQNLTSTNYPTLPSLSPSLTPTLFHTSSISPTKPNIKIIHIFHLDALKIIILAIALLTGCICSVICCLIGALIYKRQVDKISKIKKVFSEPTISLPPIIQQPTKGEMVACSEHSDSEGNMMNTGDINNKTPNLSNDIHKRVSSNATELLYQCHTTRQ